MKPERTLLLIGHPGAAVARAKELGLDVIHLQHRSKVRAGGEERADVTFLVDYPDWQVTGPLAETARQVWGFGAAVPLTDPAVEVAGRINDRYGLGGTGYETSLRFKNKWVMRRHLMDIGFPTPAAALVTDDESLSRFAAEHGFPFVVKPVDLFAGFGIFVVREPADMAAALQNIAVIRRDGMDRGPRALGPIGEFLMEEFVEGPEFSVETFSFDGRHVPVAVTEKLVQGNRQVEMGHVVPARVASGTERQLIDAAVGFLDAIGLRDGPGHTEIRLGPDGPRVIESHNRAGGDHITDMVREVYGFDFLQYTVGWPLRAVPELTGRPTADGSACVRFLAPRNGMAAAAPRVERLLERPEVLFASANAAADQPMSELRDGFDRAGLVAVRAADGEDALKLCEQLIEGCFDAEPGAGADTQGGRP